MTLVRTDVERGLLTLCDTFSRCQKSTVGYPTTLYFWKSIRGDSVPARERIPSRHGDMRRPSTCSARGKGRFFSHGRTSWIIGKAPRGCKRSDQFAGLRGASPLHTHTHTHTHVSAVDLCYSSRPTIQSCLLYDAATSPSVAGRRIKTQSTCVRTWTWNGW